MARTHPIRDAQLALSLLTVVPTAARWPEDDSADVAGWFPAVGGLLGAVGYAIAHLADRLGASHRAPFVVAVLIVIVWSLLTRLLHWDGLADVADGFWGSHDTTRRLEIMSDSHTGGFGATAVALTALLEVAAMGSLLRAHQSPMLLVPVFSRLAATAAAWLGTPARAGGLGRSVMRRPSAVGLLAAGAVLAATVFFAWSGYGVTGLGISSAGMVLAAVVPHVLARRFGGVTGDVMGASVLITEALLFAAIALVV